MSYSLHHVPVVDSTNAYARTHWHHLPDRACVYADVQHGGRGRYGRTWLAVGDGAITMTYVLKRNAELRARHDLQDVLQNVAYRELPFHTWVALTQYAALTLCRVLKGYGIEAGIKWPNDVLVHGKKIAGILSEGVLTEATGPKTTKPKAIENEDGTEAKNTSDCAKGFLGIVLGIGINVSLNAEDVKKIEALASYEVTSVLQCTEQYREQGAKQNIDRDSLLHAYNEAFFTGYDAFMQAGFASIHDEYSHASDSLGKLVQINTPTRRLTGLAKGFTVFGELILSAPPHEMSLPNEMKAGHTECLRREQIQTEQIFNSGELL